MGEARTAGRRPPGHCGNPAPGRRRSSTNASVLAIGRPMGKRPANRSSDSAGASSKSVLVIVASVRP